MYFHLKRGNFVFKKVKIKKPFYKKFCFIIIVLIILIGVFVTNKTKDQEVNNTQQELENQISAYLIS